MRSGSDVLTADIVPVVAILRVDSHLGSFGCIINRPGRSLAVQELQVRHGDFVSCFFVFTIPNLI